MLKPAALLTILKVLRNNQELPTTGSALAPSVMLQVTPDSECPDQISYQFRTAELTLVRRGRPVMPSLRVSQPQVDLRTWLRVYQPGDRIYIFIPYNSLVVVAADGKQQPYPAPQRARPKRGQLDLDTEEAKGINFTWLLIK